MPGFSRHKNNRKHCTETQPPETDSDLQMYQLSWFYKANWIKQHPAKVHTKQKETAEQQQS